ncbi:hypothetical protein HQ545_04240 [Candidatus Woesearchaeota archaeon]|nr:hypothetical protein [Candidatus Woesearchaeota archaeon]
MQEFERMAKKISHLSQRTKYLEDEIRKGESTAKFKKAINEFSEAVKDCITLSDLEQKREFEKEREEKKAEKALISIINDFRQGRSVNTKKLMQTLDLSRIHFIETLDLMIHYGYSKDELTDHINHRKEFMKTVISAIGSKNVRKVIGSSADDIIHEFEKREKDYDTLEERAAKIPSLMRELKEKEERIKRAINPPSVKQGVFQRIFGTKNPTIQLDARKALPLAEMANQMNDTVQAMNTTLQNMEEWAEKVRQDEAQLESALHEGIQKFMKTG